MKRNTLNVIVSIILLLTSLFSFASAGWGGIECYLLLQMEEKLPAADEVAEVEEAIGLMKDTEEEYLEGVELCYEGDEKILQGRYIINEGKSQLAYSEEEIAAAQAQYDEAEAQIAAAQAQVDEAKAQMEEARPEYEEGKAQLAKLEKVQPLLEKYVYFKNNTLENYDGFNSLNAWYIAVVIPYLMTLGLELPSDMDAFTESMAEQIDEGNAMMEDYEHAEAMLNEAQAEIDKANVQLAEAKTVLDAGYDTIEYGYEQIEAAEDSLYYAASKLAEGKATLEEYETAVAQLEDAMIELLKVKSVCDRRGNVAVKGIGDRLGSDFDIYKYNEEGDLLCLPDGNPRLDYDKCLKVCTAYREYVDDYGKSIHKEVMQRAVVDALLAIAAVFAFVAAIKALRGKEKAPKMSIILLAFLVAANIYGIVVGYSTFAHPDGQTAYTGIVPFLGMVLLTLVTIAFVYVCRKGGKEYLAEKAIRDAETALAEKEKALEARKTRIAEIVAEVQQKKEAAAAEEESAENVTAETAENGLVTLSVSDVEVKITPAERSDYDKARAEYEEALRKYQELRKKYADK